MTTSPVDAIFNAILQLRVISNTSTHALMRLDDINQRVSQLQQNLDQVKNDQIMCTSPEDSIPVCESFNARVDFDAVIGFDE